MDGEDQVPSLGWKTTGGKQTDCKKRDGGDREREKTKKYTV
jgi:hypothetical protein